MKKMFFDATLATTRFNRVFMKYVYLSLFAMLLQSCGTITYAPREYEIDDERISDFDLVGVVTVNNEQPDETITAVAQE